MESKQLARIANKVHTALAQWRQDKLLPPAYVPDTSHAEDCVKRMKWAASKGMWYAADQERRTALSRVSSLLSKLEYAKDLLEKPFASPPSFRDIYLDLCAVQQEFGSLAWDKDGRLCVTTEEIELEGVYLGPFRVALSLRPGSRDSSRPFAYYCIAEDPHPAARGDEYTHPHVSDEYLCEGEGSLAISNALREGRLYDFFVLVRSTLNTYATDSPYVKLDEWEGVSCSECGYIIHDRDELYRCDQCDTALCSECSDSCDTCGRTYCRQHMDRCERCGHRMCPDCESSSTCVECGKTVCGDCRMTCSDCGEDVCTKCVGECTDCKEQFCPSCLSGCEDCGDKVCDECKDEDGLCSSCHDERENDDDEESDESESDEPDESNEPAETIECPGQMRFFEEGQQAA